MLLWVDNGKILRKNDLEEIIKLAVKNNNILSRVQLNSRYQNPYPNISTSLYVI